MSYKEPQKFSAFEIIIIIMIIIVFILSALINDRVDKLELNSNTSINSISSENSNYK